MKMNDLTWTYALVGISLIIMSVLGSIDQAKRDQRRRSQKIELDGLQQQIRLLTTTPMMGEPEYTVYGDIAYRRDMKEPMTFGYAVSEQHIIKVDHGTITFGIDYYFPSTYSERSKWMAMSFAERVAEAARIEKEGKEQP